ncbi:MAG: hypothetical protein QGF90_04870 [Gammaproteobacteria bacterium]|jgi:hypothetical protein|nr:hypothetical protein [Gammaproteobacteria bacterium]|tara:strand:+ start:361 stop:732 length:372 start_codon:yes stop_codon:yes gene_type:complete
MTKLIYTTDLAHAGEAVVFGPWCWIKIHPDHHGDEGLLVHEQTHIDQHWRTWWCHSLMYWWSAEYRLTAECEAYARQYHTYDLPPHDLAEIFIDYLMGWYGLQMTRARVRGAFKTAVYTYRPA